MFKAFKGLVAGLVAGTIVGVLFAPKKGQELRKEFKKELDKGGLGLDTLRETVSEMGKDIGETSQKGYGDLSKTEAYKVAHKEIKKHAKTAQGIAKDLIDENVPAATRKKAKKSLAKAKDFLNTTLTRTKRGMNQVAKKVAEKTAKHE